jgi:mRNA interferase MazF
LVKNRGEIWWASLEDPRRSGPGYRRPVVIVQADSFNRSRINTVIILAITSNLRLAKAPGNVLIHPHDSSLPRPSVANVSQVLTVDKSYLTERIALLPARLLRKIDQGLSLVLGLNSPEAP